MEYCIMVVGIGGILVDLINAQDDPTLLTVLTHPEATQLFKKL